MKIALRDKTYNYYSKNNEPNIIVKPGEDFFAQTELCSGSWLKSLDTVWAREKENGCNPTICVKIEGAKPGDMIAVRILDILVEEVGYTGIEGITFPNPQNVEPGEWPSDIWIVAIKDKMIKWNSKLDIPVSPIIGTIGTAPVEAVNNGVTGAHGGNLDINDVTIGTTVYLPVYVNGAMLHVGDVHAIQGDGEISGWGLECRSLLRLRVDIIKKPDSMQYVRMENEDYIMGAACCDTFRESFYKAAREVLFWMVEEYGFSMSEAYTLMGLLLESKIGGAGVPTITYCCKMPKKYLIHPTPGR